MNPWKSQNYKKIYDNQDIRTGIALRFEKGVHGDIKSLFTDFTKWLRKNYYFPIRVVVYIALRICWIYIKSTILRHSLCRATYFEKQYHHLKRYNSKVIRPITGFTGTYYVPLQKKSEF